MATFGDGLVAFAIAFAFVGLFWSLTTIDNAQTDYEICIKKCPASNWDSKFVGLECPKMCEDILDKDSNCTRNEVEE